MTIPTPGTPPRLLLSSSELEQVIVDVVRSFDIEIGRYASSENMKSMLGEFLTLYHSTDLFTFFVLRNIRDTADFVFTSAERRAFIMNLTERCMMYWSTSDIEYGEYFINTMAKWIALNKVPFNANRLSLINKEVQDTIEITVPVLKAYLTDNPWVTVLYLLLVNFNRSELYRAVLANKVTTA